MTGALRLLQSSLLFTASQAQEGDIYNVQHPDENWVSHHLEALKNREFCSFTEKTKCECTDPTTKMCRNGECVDEREYQRLDGKDDCLDGSDEAPMECREYVKDGEQMCTDAGCQFTERKLVEQVAPPPAVGISRFFPKLFRKKQTPRYTAEKCTGEKPREHVKEAVCGELPSGTKVVRGRDWKWGDEQDGGEGKTGVTEEAVQPDGWVRVKWDHDKKIRQYRMGAEDKKCDLSKVAPVGTAQSTLKEQGIKSHTLI